MYISVKYVDVLTGLEYEGILTWKPQSNHNIPLAKKIWSEGTKAYTSVYIPYSVSHTQIQYFCWFWVGFQTGLQV